MWPLGPWMGFHTAHTIDMHVHMCAVCISGERVHSFHQGSNFH